MSPREFQERQGYHPDQVQQPSDLLAGPMNSEVPETPRGDAVYSDREKRG
jgi:hypothetical protein